MLNASALRNRPESKKQSKIHVTKTHAQIFLEVVSELFLLEQGWSTKLLHDGLL